MWEKAFKHILGFSWFLRVITPISTTYFNKILGKTSDNQCKYDYFCSKSTHEICTHSWQYTNIFISVTLLTPFKQFSHFLTFYRSWNFFRHLKWLKRVLNFHIFDNWEGGVGAGGELVIRLLTKNLHNLKSWVTLKKGHLRKTHT